MKPWGLHWFRRDLRICGNAALKKNWKQMEGRTLGIFCFDSTFLSRKDFSANRFAFFIETLKALRSELRSQGGDLWVMDAPPQKGFVELLIHLKKSKKPLPSLITWNRDYEPFARNRDQQMEILLTQNWGLSVHTERDHLVLEPHEVMKETGPYGVYTPFYNKWRLRMQEPSLLQRIESQSPQSDYYRKLLEWPASRAWDSIHSDHLPLFKIQWNLLIEKQLPCPDLVLQEFEKKTRQHVTVPIPKAGSTAAFQKLLAYIEDLPHYKDQRDFPAQPGTSMLSLYLKNGSLTTAQIIYQFQLLKAKDPQREQYLKELVWREFYYSIIFHHPEVENNPYQSKYADLKWKQNHTEFERWCAGMTGFPIVDAGMRQLNKTGWMHNRVRMIVASFLTKDLLIDWKWGADYFMKMLLDGDLAPNNGGWQWAASTGCDPQPYFRIFNPWLQSSKFDPDGIYIKEFVPELRNAPTKALHDPTADRSPWNYPAPMVNHARQRMEALQLFSEKK